MPYMNHTVSLYRGKFDFIISYNESESLAIGERFDESPCEGDEQGKSVTISGHEFRFNKERGTWVARFKHGDFILAYEIFYDLTQPEDLEVVSDYVVTSVSNCKEDYATLLHSISPHYASKLE